jgi:hypothetical protein
MADAKSLSALFGLGALFVAVAVLGATLGLMDGERGMIGARLLLGALSCG